MGPPLVQFDNLAVYLPQCVQHIYLATSTLRGVEGILGNDGVDLNDDIIQFQ